MENRFAVGAAERKEGAGAWREQRGSIDAGMCETASQWRLAV